MKKRKLKTSLKWFINNIEAWQSADVVYCCYSVLNYVCEMDSFIFYYLLCLWGFWNRELWIRPLSHLKEKKYIFFLSWYYFISLSSEVFHSVRV